MANPECEDCIKDCDQSCPHYSVLTLDDVKKGDDRFPPVFQIPDAKPDDGDS